MSVHYYFNNNTDTPTFDELLDSMPKNDTIINNLIKGYNIFSNPEYQNICCSISGGSDSDVVMDLCSKLAEVCGKKITYCFCNTGLESKWTIAHLDELEQRYHTKIERIRPDVPVPLAVREHGQPFLSKQVSENIMRLQAHGFQYEDDTFQNLLDKYCEKSDKPASGYAHYNGAYYRGCYSALEWWCNEKGEKSQFNINYNKGLKEFLIKNPPTFKIANICCFESKKKPMHDYLFHPGTNELRFDLVVIGVRKQEGGVRKAAYHNCFSPTKSMIKKGENIQYAEYRPLFFYSDKDKAQYVEHFGITHSKLYGPEYGLKRTGCCGCPFGQNSAEELEALERNEPQLTKAAKNIFRDSIAYEEQYQAFRKNMKEV